MKSIKATVINATERYVIHLDIPIQNDDILLSVIGSIIAEINFNNNEKIAILIIGEIIV